MFIWRLALLTPVVGLAALASSAEDWQPVSLVAALAALMVVADIVPVTARRIRLSAGLMVQVVVMALLGPAPAVAIGIGSTLIDWRVNRVPHRLAMNNIVLFAVLGLVGGLAFELVRARYGLDRHDTAYAILAMPIYLAVAALNLALVVVNHPGYQRRERLLIIRDTGLPSLPLELLSAVMAGAVVLVWAHAGLAAAAALMGVLIITVPLARAVADALKSGDDLLALRHVSDERAAEVARLASDRDRLLTELVEAEQRERARLAESLHDGPVQRLVAVRQDMAEGATVEQLTERLDVALGEARAIISAFHPVTVSERGFAASVRAAAAPFPAAQNVELTIDSAVDDRFLAGTLLLPVAQELVVNAVKHASPSSITLTVRGSDGRVVMEVVDDGVGIDTSDAGRAVQAGHLGLAMVRRRMDDVGGRLDIETRADGGTRSRITLPIDLPPGSRMAPD
jgi:signal transduction histidine kinase